MTVSIKNKEESLNEKLLKQQCTICLCDIEKGQSIALPPCDCIEILYHSECFFKWITRNPTCPTCRIPIKIIDSDDEKDASEDEGEEEISEAEPEISVEDLEDYHQQLQVLIQEHGQSRNLVDRSRIRFRQSALDNLHVDTHNDDINRSIWNNCGRCMLFFFFVFWVGTYILHN
jgi:hypothetical protein